MSLYYNLISNNKCVLIRDEDYFDFEKHLEYDPFEIQLLVKELYNRYLNDSIIIKDLGVFESVTELEEADSILIDIYSEISLKLYIEYEETFKTLRYLDYFEFKQRIPQYYIYLFLSFLAVLTPYVPGYIPFVIILIMILNLYRKCYRLEKLIRKWRMYDVLTFFRGWINILATYEKWCDNNNQEPISFYKLEDDSFKLFKLKLYIHTGESGLFRKIKNIGLNNFSVWISYLESRFDLNYNK